MKQPQLLKFNRAELYILECLEVDWGMKWRPCTNSSTINTIQVSSVSKGSEGTGSGTEAAGSSCSTQDYEVHVCHCKQFEDQVKQLEKEVAESKGEAAEMNRQTRRGKR